MLPDKDGPGAGGRQSCLGGEDASVSLFRDYLRLKTVHPEPDYGETVSYSNVKSDSPCGMLIMKLWQLSLGIYTCLHLDDF